MKATGEDLRKLLSVPPDSVHDARLAWFPDGRRIAFGSANRAGDEFSIQSYDLDSGSTKTILSDPKAGDFCFAADGRIIYSRLEDAPDQKSANLWEAAIDFRSGRMGAPRRLTNWPGSLFTALGVTTDSTRLFFLRLHYQNSVYVGNLEDRGARLINPRRFSFESWTAWPTGWTRDAKYVLFNSGSHGHRDIFKQPIAGHDPLDLIDGTGVRPEEREDARLTPDGKWLLYLAWPFERGRPAYSQGRLMRASAAGAQPSVVFPVAGYSSRMRTDPLVSISAEGHPAFRCPSTPRANCVLSEQIQEQVVFTAFDPVEGRKAELARVPASGFTFWDLSPDGQWIASGKNQETSGKIRLIPLYGGTPREIDAGGWTHLIAATWAAGGDALYVTAFASEGAPLLHVALDGTTKMLYRGLKYVESPVASPDGRILAFGEMTEDGNGWILDTPRRH